jgi:uroporphyrinogen decarboxylase
VISVNERDVVYKALDRNAPPHLPWQIDVTEGVGKLLAEYYGSPDYQYKNIGNHLAREKNKNHVQLDDTHHRDIFGVVWQKESGGDIGVVANNLLPEPEFGDYVLPEPNAELIGSKCRTLVEGHPERFKVFEFNFSFFERAWTLRGMENMLTDFLLEPEFVEELFERLFEYNLAGIKIAASYDIDAIMFGDDWGQQQGLIMGAPIWHKFIKPYMTRLFAEVKSRSKFVMLHSCGDISEIMGDLVDMGLDIYNTFQPEVYDMERFKKEYGKHITVYGGISTQGVLANGTPEDVRESALRAMDILGSDGGYIVAPTHQIPEGTPIENIISLAETARGNLHCHAEGA